MSSVRPSNSGCTWIVGRALTLPSCSSNYPEFDGRTLDIVHPLNILHACLYYAFILCKIALAEAARTFRFLKNSLVQINSKLNSKPYDYLYKLGGKMSFHENQSNSYAVYKYLN